MVFHSGCAGLLPIPDAFLGAIGYLVEALASTVGGGDRSIVWPAMSERLASVQFLQRERGRGGSL